MAVTATNLIQGPATVYRGAFGAVEPLDATVAIDPLVWTDCGGTQDGVSLNIESEWSQLTVDQLVDDVGSVRTKRSVTIKTSLAEATLENLAIATANKLPVDGRLTPSMGVDAFLPDYGAVLLVGVAPGGMRRVVIIRRTVATDNVETAYKKDGQTLVPITWRGHYVTESIPPYEIIDEPEA